MKTLRLLPPSVTPDSYSWISSLAPAFAALFILIVVGIGIGVTRYAYRWMNTFQSKRHQLSLDAVPSGRHVIWGAYPGQVQNYHNQTAQLCDASVVLHPSHGLPESVTIVVHTKVGPALEEKRAKIAWLHCVEMRRNYLDPVAANHCEVRMTDGRGRLLALVNNATAQQDLHCSGAPETVLSHSSAAMRVFLHQ